MRLTDTVAPRQRIDDRRVEWVDAGRDRGARHRSMPTAAQREGASELDSARCSRPPGRRLASCGSDWSNCDRRPGWREIHVQQRRRAANGDALLREGCSGRQQRAPASSGGLARPHRLPGCHAFKSSVLSAECCVQAKKCLSQTPPQFAFRPLRRLASSIGFQAKPGTSVPFADRAATPLCSSFSLKTVYVGRLPTDNPK